MTTINTTCPKIEAHSLHQVVLDLFESIAMQESALSYILCAESQKMKTALNMDGIDLCKLLAGSLGDLRRWVARHGQAWDVGLVGEYRQLADSDGEGSRRYAVMGQKYADLGLNVQVSWFVSQSVAVANVVARQRTGISALLPGPRCGGAWRRRRIIDACF